MENRDRIIREAMTLFAERGYHAVGVQEIVSKSEITKPTLYHYFGNKEGLFLTLLDGEFAPLVDHLEYLTRSEEDIFVKMQNILSYLLKMGEMKKDFFQVYLTLSFSPPLSEEMRIGGKFIKNIERLLEDMFIQASYSHGNMRGRHRNYSASFLGLLNSSLSRLMRGEIEISNDFICKTVHHYAHGIYS